MAHTVHAPSTLRRRVIGSVRSKPSRRDSAAGAAVRAALLRAAVLALPTALAAIALALLPRPSHPPTLEPGSGSPRATLHAMAGRGEVMLADVPQSPPGKIYELWERRAGTARLLPTDALFAVARGGRAAVGVPGGLRGLRELLVTLEPVGGSSVPTGPALLRIVPTGASR
jgi:hypothetical protein